MGRRNLAFDLVVTNILLEGCMPSDLDWCPIHSQMLGRAMVTCKIIEGIPNVLIVGLGNVTNSIEPQFMAEGLTANIPSERFLLEIQSISCKFSIQPFAKMLPICSVLPAERKDWRSGALLVSHF